MMVYDLRVVVGHRPGHHIIYGAGKGQGQVMGLAPTQHFSEIALGVYVQQQDFLAVHRKTGPQVVDRGAFAYAALLVCYTDYLWFRHFGVSSLP